MPHISENRQLKQQFRELVEKAQENQIALERCQKFELAMLAAENIAALLETLLFTAMRHFDLADCRLIWFDRQHIIRPLVDESTRQQFGHRLIFTALNEDVEELFKRTLKPVLRPLTPMEKVRWFPGKTQVASVAFLPLVRNGELMGCLLLGSHDEKRFTPDKAVDFMSHMAMIASLCLQNSVNQEQVRLLSMLDNLTKVKNRRAFDDDMRKEVARAHRSGEALSCLFIDADFFKKINDTYGHQTGDETLRQLASWVKAQLRESDHLARYGGEEFAVLLPNCDEALACQIAERIRQSVEQQQVVAEGASFGITLSIGVTTFDPREYDDLPHEQAIKSLLGHADAGVYAAKEGGRNRVCLQPFSSVFDHLAVS